MSLIKTLEDRARQYRAPEFVTEDLIYLTVGGSKAYGVVHPKSDTDLYGICIPPKEKVFPTFAGFIPGFGSPVTPWLHWGYLGERTDIKVYSIVRFFDMAMKGNPNIIEILFTDENLILIMEELGVNVRGSRELFLTNNVIPKFMGFFEGKRRHMFDYIAPDDTEFMYNRKAAYHSMRLLLELEQLLETGTMSLSAYSDLLTGIRFGAFAAEDVKTMVDDKAEQVRSKEKKSVLRLKPNEEYIKQVLIEMLETYWDFTLDIP